MHLEESLVSSWNIKKGDFICGVFRLMGYICYDDHELRETIKGKVVEVERFEFPSNTFMTFITLETIPTYTENRKSVTI
jgi:hypothetical protein